MYINARVSRTAFGRKIEYSYKEYWVENWCDTTVKFIKSLPWFNVCFADSVWYEGEQEEIKSRWQPKCLN